MARTREKGIYVDKRPQTPARNRATEIPTTDQHGSEAPKYNDLYGCRRRADVARFLVPDEIRVPESEIPPVLEGTHFAVTTTDLHCEG